jgi:hypothetical protein
MKNDKYSITTGWNENDDVVWCVNEKKTLQVINSFFFEDEAKKYVKFLEKNGAFDGFTPSFMLVLPFASKTGVPAETEIVFSVA